METEIKKENAGNDGDNVEFKPGDLKFVNVDFDSPSTVVRLLQQAELFRRGDRTFNETHYLNFQIGIKKALDYLNHELTQEPEADKRGKIAENQEKVKRLDEDLQKMMDGNFSFLDYRQTAVPTVSIARTDGLTGNELWVHVEKGTLGGSWRGVVCNREGVNYQVHTQKDGGFADDVTPIFSDSLTLVDAWHTEGDDQNQIKFKLKLGGLEYKGTKTEIANLITDSGLSGTDPRMIRLAIASCVEYFVSHHIVKVREAYEAIGVYERNGKLHLITDKNKIVSERGTESWLVSQGFHEYQGDIIKDLKIFAELRRFFDNDKLALMFGYSAIAPFFYALKGCGNFFVPLNISQGPRGTGKTTLGELFTRYLYGIPPGGPSDVTSEFRLLDFMTGTTFPRLVDEAENAKFTGIGTKITATLKDASQRQFVGVRGNPDKSKKLYAARTPLELAGNKFSLEDQALRARSIFTIFDTIETKSGDQRGKLQSEVLSRLTEGFGLKLVQFTIQNFPDVRGLLAEIRKQRIDYHFADSRREDFYGAIFFGLSQWAIFYRSLGIQFPLSAYTEITRFVELVKKYETTNNEESRDNQSVTAFIDWVKTKMGLLEHYESERQSPPQYMELKQMFRKAERDGKTGILVTQTALGEFKRFSPAFSDSTLSEIAESLSKFFNVSKEYFYRRQTEFIGGHNARAVWIPLDNIALDAYENEHKNDNTYDESGSSSEGVTERVETKDDLALPSMTQRDNETVERTSKQMPDPPQSSQPPNPTPLTHLLITQDIPEFSWTDGDWKLRKNDDAYVPSELAKTLISRGWAREIPKPSDKETITDSTASNSSEDNAQGKAKNPTPITTVPITKEQGDKAVQVLHERGIHLNGADTGVSVYGDKYNIAVPVNFYRQNAERVDQVMSELGFSKGNTGQLHNVFFDRSLKGGGAQ